MNLIFCQNKHLLISINTWVFASWLLLSISHSSALIVFIVYTMSTLRFKYSFIECSCFIPVEWILCPRPVLEYTLQKEISKQCKKYNTSENTMVSIFGVAAISVEYKSTLWFRRIDETCHLVDLTRYSRMKIEYFEALEVGTLQWTITNEGKM